MQFEFDDARFDRIFPFYILVGENLKVLSVGKTMEKVCPGTVGKRFVDCFEIKRPAIETSDFNSLSKITDQLVVVECIENKSIVLRGQIELDNEGIKLLFIGSPWFGSMDQVINNNLKIKDFAFHDPLIDLLHVLKTQEISNDDLKQLTKIYRKQKEELIRANQEIQDIALFPTQNPDPLTRIDRFGNLLKLNPAAEKLSEFVFRGVSYSRNDFWKKLSGLLDPTAEKEMFEAESSGRIYSFVIKSLPDLGYYNIYGRDITQQRKDEEQLKILSSIAEKNTHGVVIANKSGVLEWANESFIKMSGYRLDELTNTKPGKFLQGENTDKETVAYISRQVKLGEPFNCEILNYHKSGRPYWVRILGQALKDEDGNVIKYFAIEEDITEKREAEERIRELESKFRIALEKIGDNVWEHDFRTGKTYFSKKISEFLGVEPANDIMNDKLWWASIHKGDLPILIENDRKCRNGEIDSQSLEYRVVSADGSVRWVLDRGVVTEKDEKGLPLRIIGTHTDITKIKAIENELSTRLKQFKSLTENIPGIVYEYEFRPDGTEGFRYISSAIERILGITAEQFYNYAKYIHPEDLPVILEKVRLCKETLSPFYYEARILVPGREEMWHSVSSSFSYNSAEGSAVFIGFMLDITDQKKFEKAIRANEEKYRSIIANMNLGLMEVDSKHKITFANKRLCDMVKIDTGKIIGVDADSFLMQNSVDFVHQREKELVKGNVDVAELEILIGGEKSWWLVSAAPKYSEFGEFEGAVVICLDIKERKDLELQLIKAREKAEHLGRTKEIFLANMSHEIRTPMNAIIGMGRQLDKTPLEKEQKLFVKTIQAAADNLLVIINDILDFSKIEAGKLELEHIGFKGAEVVAQIVRIMEYKAEEKGILLTNSVCDSRVAPILKGDPHRLNQVLLNLVSNSIKFTEKGKVDIRYEVIGDTSTMQKLRITVEDTGIGMDEDFVSQIFDKFTQEYKSGSRKYGGTGLGMSISKDLIEMMGGTIEVKSKKGTGTEVMVVLELEKGTPADLPAEEQIAIDENFLKGKRIIVADDNDNNRLVASFILQNYKAEIMEAGDGQKVLDILSKTDADLILMDLQMPVMNGFDATSRIRESGNQIPIIALTANAIKGENDRCIAAGMNDYISKPFKEENFLNTIAKWTTKSGSVRQKQSEEDTVLTIPSEKLFDLENLLPFSRGNEAFLKQMLALFCDQAPVEVEKMMEAYHAKDIGEVGAIAHKLKPSIDNFNINILKEDIRFVERAGKEKEDSPELRDALQKVKNTVEQVIAQMRAEF
jgi:PAS domain S-box